MFHAFASSSSSPPSLLFFSTSFYLLLYPLKLFLSIGFALLAIVDANLYQRQIHFRALTESAGLYKGQDHVSDTTFLLTAKFLFAALTYHRTLDLFESSRRVSLIDHSGLTTTQIPSSPQPPLQQAHRSWVTKQLPPHSMTLIV